MTKEKSTSFDGGPVGYKRPPAEHQFKPGRKPSGGGRQKGTKNRAPIAERILSETLLVTEKGRPRRVTAWEALLMKARAAALTGSIDDIRKFLAIMERVLPNYADTESNVIRIASIPGDEGL